VLFSYDGVTPTFFNYKRTVEPLQSKINIPFIVLTESYTYTTYVVNLFTTADNYFVSSIAHHPPEQIDIYYSSGLSLRNSNHLSDKLSDP